MSKLDTLISWPLHKDKVYGFLDTLLERDYWITIKLYREKRSNQANSYYWVGIVDVICEFHGLNPKIEEHRNRIHEMLKRDFNSETVGFNRTVFKVIDGDFLDFNEVRDYLEKKGFENLRMSSDNCLLLPLYVVDKIPENREYGEVIEVEDYYTLPKSTTANDTVEFYEYCERIRDHYAIEHNLYISEPKQKTYSEL